jgi:very-short-patch-repair endonuclease
MRALGGVAARALHASTGCAALGECRMPSRSNTREFVSKARQIHRGRNYDYSHVRYVRSTDKVSIGCPEHGAFLMTPNSHLAGQGCPKCGKERAADSQRGTYLPEAAASRWAVEQGIASKAEFEALRAAKRLPDNIPGKPCRIYKTTWVRFLQLDPRKAKDRAWWSYAQAQAWTLEAGIVSKKQWKALIASGELPPQIPAKPFVIYRGDWKSWRVFFNRPLRRGVSIAEKALALELEHFMRLTQGRPQIVLENGKRKFVDMLIPGQKLVLEYDGRHFHRNKRKLDQAQTKQLEAVGYHVVRVRERPLRKIHETDVLTQPEQPTYRIALTVLQHLRLLGFLGAAQDSAIKAYAKRGAPLTSSAKLRSSATWMPVDEALALVQRLGLTTATAYRKAHEAGRLPADIPSRPARVYGRKVWGIWQRSREQATSPRRTVRRRTPRALLPTLPGGATSGETPDLYVAISE